MRSQYIKLLAYYHFLGGAIGCFLCITAFWGSIDQSTAALLIYGAAFLLYIFSIYAGYVGLQGSTPRFLQLVFPYQLIQIVTFSFDQVVTYKFFSGLAIVIGVPLSDPLHWQFKLTLSTFLVSWQRPIASFVGINVIAVLLAYWIAQHRWSRRQQGSSSTAEQRASPEQSTGS